MKTTIRELGKTTSGTIFQIEIRGPLPTGEVVRERYRREHMNLDVAKEWVKHRVFALIRGEDERGEAAPTLATLWAIYEEQHIKSSRLKPSQVRGLASIWDNHLKPTFGEQHIDDIDYGAIQSFKASRSHLAPKSVNNILISLRAVLRFAIKLGRLDKLPDIEMLKVPKASAAYYDVPTYNALVAGAARLSDRHLAIVLLGGDAGLRAGEMLALDAADLELPILHVRRSVWRGNIGTTKGNAERLLPLTARTVAVLSRLATRPGPILRTRNGTRLNYTMLVRALRQAQEEAGVPALSLHKLRHTYGTDITRALGIRAAQALLGHAEVKTTERYSHVHAGPELARALERHRAGSGHDADD